MLQVLTFLSKTSPSFERGASEQAGRHHYRSSWHINTWQKTECVVGVEEVLCCTQCTAIHVCRPT